MSNAAGNALLEGLSPGAGGEGGAAAAKRALSAIRAHLGMEVAYISEFVGDQSVFREVDAPGLEALIKVGDSQQLDDIFCRHILAGRLPELMPDVTAEPLAMSLPIMQAVPIRKHMSVPVRLEDGETYGMFCCLGFATDHSLQQRDLQMMRAFADLAAFEISREREAEKIVTQKRASLRRVIDDGLLAIAFQPIVDVETGRPIGVESLSRFPDRSPDLWFAEAADVGMGVELELAAIALALAALPRLPHDVYLAINASPGTITSEAFLQVIDGVPLDRIVLEVTEHAGVDDYDQLRCVLEPLRGLGVRIAVDDAGAGYSSLRHILALQPDLIKLDMSLTRNISLDPARRALAAALIGFSVQTGSRLIAEGVETAAELTTLRGLGVEKAQGYFLGKPAPLDAAIAFIEQAAVTPREAYA